MSNLNYKEQLKEWLDDNFPEVKLTETEGGYKFNKEQLSSTDIHYLAWIEPKEYRAIIKRSGTRLVVIINGSN